MQTATDLDLEILNDLEFELPCQSRIKGHECSGAPQWVASYLYGHPSIFVCENAHSIAMSRMGDGFTVCGHCLRARQEKVFIADCWHYSPLPK